MKKVLLASTMLVGTAGFAAADVSFVGSAYVGMSYATGGSGIFAYNMLVPDMNATLTAIMSTTTDGGLEAGASFTMLAPGLNMQKDPGDDQFPNAANAILGRTSDWPGAGAFSLGATAFLAGSWGRLSVAYDHDSDDNPFNGNQGDVTATYTNTWGAFGLEAYYVMAPYINGVSTTPMPVTPWWNGGTATDTNGDFGVKGTYTFGDYSVWAAYDYDASNAALPTDMRHYLSAGVSASMSGFTGAAEVEYNVNGVGAAAWDYSVSLGYATGPYSVEATWEKGNTVTGSVGYDLGGGVSLVAGGAHEGGTNNNVYYGGVRMSF